MPTAGQQIEEQSWSQSSRNNTRTLNSTANFRRADAPLSVTLCRLEVKGNERVMLGGSVRVPLHTTVTVQWRVKRLVSDDVPESSRPTSPAPCRAPPDAASSRARIAGLSSASGHSRPHRRYKHTNKYMHEPQTFHTHVKGKVAFAYFYWLICCPIN